MDPSKSNTNLYPGRRANMTTPPRSNPPKETETSRFFAPSRSSDKPRPADDDDASKSTTDKKHRQTLLSFTSSGQLATKQPLVNPTPRSDARRLTLAETAAETISLLPGLLATRPDVGTAGHLLPQTLLGPLDPKQDDHPHLAPITVRVIDADTIDAALALAPPQSTTSTNPVLVLNMANASHAGGGFKHGALAQEEALCYRSSLFFTLKIRHYPIPDRAAIYSPAVLVIRESMSVGHALLDLRDPSRLPVVSAVSVAAVCRPDLTLVPSSGGGKSQKYTYARTRDRELMKDKMRGVLRVGARGGHRRIVLGALGCGAFWNPSWEVAALWRGVLGEREFGGWWEEVVFAVLGAGTENFEVFRRELDGMTV
ncbi:uncharacterized protein HMPREF1541_00545 [Cyphellophora europaea CBS 101466]|uniref:Microbial-type PARG catalytic domain-containing protein n=1 Tax=Cyphellophora europaea (strain CBS 101466) TaxID=1220924 RepID=W2SCC3_CYPE1|nr:uncharacterized protein HMPREF1541_00545 [Cyphellophora europaea CBS 101466]ETN46361.1 hypothetical protein HMPREF1541_00545 [Cyphellophora europaea CBS 101466]